MESTLGLLPSVGSVTACILAWGGWFLSELKLFIIILGMTFNRCARLSLLLVVTIHVLVGIMGAFVQHLFVLKTMYIRATTFIAVGTYLLVGKTSTGHVLE